MMLDDDGPRAPRIADHQLRKLIELARVALDDLEQGVMWPKDEDDGRRLELTAVDLLVRSQATGTRVNDAIGFPRSTRAGAGGASPGAVSDPVGGVVTALPSTLVRMAAAQLVDGLEKGVAELQRSVAALLQVAPPEPPEERPHTPPPACRSCERLNRFEEIHRGLLCRWCYDWMLNHRGVWPPVEVLAAHHRGERITTRFADVIAASLPDEPKKRRRVRK